MDTYIDKFKNKFLGLKKIVKGIRVISLSLLPTKEIKTPPSQLTLRLGRKHFPDIRDNKFKIEDHISHLLNTPKLLTSRYWSNTEWCGDQKDTPMCVGYGWAHWIEGGPRTHTGTHPVVNPETIYNGAQANDEWPGPPPVYDGTSVRGGAKWLKLQNKIFNQILLTKL